MTATLHTVEDLLTGDQIWFGFGDKAYRKAMDFINTHQEYRGGERYEYFGGDEELDFVWKLDEDGLKKIVNNTQEPDVFGAVHLGKLLVEFRCSNDGFDDDNHDCVCDTYLLGKYNPDLDYWVGQIPYDMLEDDPYIIKRRTLDHFKSAFEQQMTKYLNKHTELIEHAICETVVDLWY